jgi:hypothetical protein
MNDYNYDVLKLAFENGAKKKGYSFEKDELGNYEDNWLQEAWEIFFLIDLNKALNKNS